MVAVRNPKSASLAEASAHLCLTPKRFIELTKRGTLTKPDGAGYDLDLIRREYLDFLRGHASIRQLNGLDPIAERARKDKELADRVALQNAKTRGGIVPVKLLQQALDSAADRFRQRLAPLPAQLAAKIVGKPRSQTQKLLRDRFYAVLAELSEEN